MDSDNLVLTGWSYGLAGLAYAVLSIALWQRGYGKAPREPARLAMLVAALASAAWGSLLLAFLFTGQGVLLRLSDLADVLRYGGWFVNGSRRGKLMGWDWFGINLDDGTELLTWIHGIWRRINPLALSALCVFRDKSRSNWTKSMQNPCGTGEVPGPTSIIPCSGV